tara:strand:+ start:645 stop:1478 length:834 start_codon:yes stop_codon:yes gene_type:complete
MAAERDPRWWKVDDDPLEAHHRATSHQAARDDGNWRQRRIHVQVGSEGRVFSNLFADVRTGGVSLHKGSIWHFSSTEIRQLMLATGAFTLALALMFNGGIWGGIGLDFPIICIFALVSFGPAFLLHEFAHKFVARYYGCWAEFRADPGGLRFGIILAAVVGIVFMAPGAVVVAGNATRSQFGKIAVAGPVSNMVLWLIGYMNWIFLEMLGIESGLIKGVNYFWLIGNSILCAFNMLPFGPLDGKKIKSWSEPIFYLCVSIAVTLVYITLQIDNPRAI